MSTSLTLFAFCGLTAVVLFSISLARAYAAVRNAVLRLEVRKLNQALARRHKRIQQLLRSEQELLAEIKSLRARSDKAWLDSISDRDEQVMQALDDRRMPCVCKDSTCTCLASVNQS